jgi:hypothetical protein
METNRVNSPLLRALLMVMCAVWTMSGWYFIATRTFSTRPTRFSVETVVDGPSAVLAGALLVALGLIAFAILLQGAVSKKSNRLTLLALLFVVPATVVVLR